MYIYAALTNKNLLGALVSVCNWRAGLRTFYQKNTLPADIHSLSLFFFKKGRIRVDLNGTEFSIGKNDLLLMQPGDTCTLKPEAVGPVSYFNIGIAPATSEGTVSTLKELGLEPFYRVRRAGEMTSLVRALSKAFHGKGRTRLQECSILGLRILLLLGPAQEPLVFAVQETENRPPADRILDTLEYINRNYKQRLEVRQLAAKAAMHITRFSRVFKQATGLSPHRYILEKKIFKARDSLLINNESLTLTAEELGFHDYSHFYKVFRRVTKVTPGAFLRKAQGKFKPD